ncbi:tetratricopeptide repeat protein [bacterium]|nr:tetratricopeptide repeat protein [bacterium]
MKTTLKGAAILLLVLLFMSCASTSSISIKVLKPAAISMPGVHKIGVVDFHGVGHSGSQIATLMQSMLLETGYYEILEREKISRILEEQNMAMSGIVDDQSAIQAGALLGVDALVFGDVTTYEIEPDKKITRKVKEKKHTGKYQWVEEKDKKSGTVKRVKKEIVEDVWVDKSYWVRRGTVAINYRVVNVKTGRLLAAYSDSRSYDSSKEKRSIFSSFSNNNTLKPKGEILNNLSKEICSIFAHKIAPYYVSERRVIESGEGNIDVGRKYAESGLWPEAKEAWIQAVKDMPEEPAAFYDLGLAFEVEGDLTRAEKAFKAAVKLESKKLYMQALTRIRNSIKEKEKLNSQLGN